MEWQWKWGWGQIENSKGVPIPSWTLCQDSPSTKPFPTPFIRICPTHPSCYINSFNLRILLSPTLTNTSLFLSVSGYQVICFFFFPFHSLLFFTCCCLFSTLIAMWVFVSLPRFGGTQLWFEFSCCLFFHVGLFSSSVALFFMSVLVPWGKKWVGLWSNLNDCWDLDEKLVSDLINFVFVCWNFLFFQMIVWHSLFEWNWIWFDLVWVFNSVELEDLVLWIWLLWNLNSVLDCWYAKQLQTLQPAIWILLLWFNETGFGHLILIFAHLIRLVFSSSLWAQLWNLEVVHLLIKEENSEENFPLGYKREWGKRKSWKQLEKGRYVSAFSHSFP